MTEPPPVPIERLLAESSWLSRLAQGLAPTSDQAEDAAQETWLAALRRPPREARGLRGWLATVLRHALRRSLRAARRREAREREAGRAATAPLPDPAALVARMEMQQVVARAVLALDEPERSTLVLRYYEGLASPQIAARLGIPASTVRTRLRRALERLRRDLDRNRGGRAAWLPALLPLVAPRWVTPAAGSASPPSAAVDLTMSTIARIGLAGAVVLAGILALRSLTTTDPQTPAPRRGAPTATAGAGRLEAGDRVEEPMAVTEGGRVEAGDRIEGPAAAAGEAPGAEAAKASPGGGTMRGIVLGEDAGPLERVRVRVSPCGDGRSLASDRTDAEGRFLLAVPEPDGRTELVVEADGYVPDVRPLREVLEGAGAEMRFVLRRGLSISGTLRDDAGVPLATSVWAIRIEEEGSSERSVRRRTLARSDASGRFEIRGLVPGRYRVEAADANYVAGDGSAPECAAGAVDVEVIAYRAVCLRLRFQDESGGPLRETVTVRLRSGAGEERGGEGEGSELVLRGVPAGAWRLVVRSPNREPFERRLDLRIEESPFDLPVPLVRTAEHGFGTVRGKVVWPEGADAATVRVFVQETMAPIPWFEADAAGGFEIPRLPAGRIHVYAATADGRWVARRAEARLAPGSTAEVTLRPEPAGGLRLRFPGIESCEEDRVEVRLIVEGDFVHRVFRPSRARPEDAWEIDSLAPGPVRVLAVAGDRILAAAEAAVSAGSTQDLDLALPARAGSVRAPALPDPVRPAPPAPEARPPARDPIEGLTHPDSRERLRAVQALAASGKAEAVPALASVLRDDPDLFVRRAAAKGLGGIGEKARDAVPDLIRALADPDSFVAAEAQRSLLRLGVEDPGWRPGLSPEAVKALVDAALERVARRDD